MSRDIEELGRIINENVRRLVESSSFQSWLQEQKPQTGDLIVLNNSFIFRSRLVKTTKNNQYLCVRIERTKGEKVDFSSVMIAMPGEMNSDFKLFRKRPLPPVEPLEAVLYRELEHLGQLIFVLIGALEDSSATVAVKHRVVRELKFDPSCGDAVGVEGLGTGQLGIVVGQLVDPDRVWRAVELEIQNEIDDVPALKKAFDPAFQQLQEAARIKLSLPTIGSSTEKPSFLSQLRSSVAQQRQEYEQAVKEYEGSSGTDRLQEKEIMRIAYNFADDAIKVLQLLVSISDLKAVLLWCTLKEHFELAQAFRNLPWIRSDKKPSLEEYKGIISNARNRAFHNLFSFDRTIEADLDGIQFRARRLTLLPAYSRRKNTIFLDYDDRELVEVFAELTRAPEIAVPLEFWTKNRVVIMSFETLLEETEDALWLLHRAITGKTGSS